MELVLEEFWKVGITLGLGMNLYIVEGYSVDGGC